MASMTYRVATTPTGRKLWWCEHDIIPDTHTDTRPATAEEAAIMDKIVHAKRQPSLALGEKIQRMLADT